MSCLRIQAHPLSCSVCRFVTQARLGVGKAMLALCLHFAYSAYGHQQI